MDIKFDEIFTEDRVKALISDGHEASIILKENKLFVRIVKKVDDVITEEDIEIHELNTMHDYGNYVMNTFRRSDMNVTKVYDNVHLTSDQMDQLYCGANMATEANEINQIIIRNFFFGKPIDRIKLISEKGDTAWYFAALLKLFKFKLRNVLKANVIKLKIRYPDKDINLRNKDEEKENKEIQKFLDDNE